MALYLVGCEQQGENPRFILLKVIQASQPLSPSPFGKFHDSLRNYKILKKFF
jgi:hypothetical protein